MTLAQHIPVMLPRVLETLMLGPGQIVVDGTLGMGGHFAAMREALAGAGGEYRLIGLDRDPESLATVGPGVDGDERVTLLCRDFAALPVILTELGLDGLDRLFLDLGVSRDQLVSERFSFRGDSALDGRLDPRRGPSVADLLADLSEAELARILTEYGDEPFARRIAAGIVAAREREPLIRADQLVELVRRAYPPSARHRRAHVATRTFQALRLAANGLLDSLDRVLREAPSLLRPRGRMVVLAYHSAEDRRVKLSFRDWATQPGYWLPRRKADKPTAEECERNPSARSALLRVLAREG